MTCRHCGMEIEFVSEKWIHSTFAIDDLKYCFSNISGLIAKQVAEPDPDSCLLLTHAIDADLVRRILAQWKEESKP